MGRILKIVIGIAAAILVSWAAGNFIFIPGTFQKNPQLSSILQDTWVKALSFVPSQSVPTSVPARPTQGSTPPTNPPSLPSYRSFAVCLREKGLKMYGTKTCPNCIKQKELFGDGVNELTLIDCDDQASLCQEKNIRGYPTWEFPDGRMIGGVIPLEYFSQQTGCALPK